MKNLTAPNIEQLKIAAKYELIEKFLFAETIVVARKYLWQMTLPMIFYWLTNVLIIAVTIWLILQSEIAFSDKLSKIGIGFLFTYIILVPVHEHIHAFMFRFFGAKSVKVKYLFKNLTAYCVANDFVISGKNFVAVCLTPFVIISFSLVTLIFLFDDSTRLFLLGALILHTGACSGDFALSNLIWLNRQNHVWTYDNSTTETSYFFKQINA